MLGHTPEDICDLWLELINSIKQNKGLVMVSTHAESHLGGSPGMLKAYEHLLEILSQDKEAWFLLVGGIPGHRDDYVESLRTRASRPGLAGRTAIIEWQADIESVFLACDALVHTAAAEPFGRVLIEAMNAGLPVVAVRAAGPAEIVEAGISGLLAEPGDIAGLARLMLRLKHDPSLAERLSSAGRQRVERLFRARHTAAKVDLVYRRIQRTGARLADRN